MTSTILYFMHIEWEWTKQRPQFIAEGLSEFYRLHIFFPVSYFSLLKKLISKDKNLNVFLHPIPYLPLYLRIKIIYDLNKFIWRIYLFFFIKMYKPEYIWITFPSLFDYLSFEKNSKIIYDCMDDALAFDPRFYFIDNLLKSERELIKKSSVIFVSANSLASKLDQRKKCKDKIVLIRNAFDGKIFSTKDSIKKKELYKIGYVGSISSWFDFESLYYTLDNLKNIEYHLVGPLDTLPKPHKRVKIYGSVNHEDLYTVVKDFDCFIMPFKVNDLIISVDPVKLNEYINYNKPIISTYYTEIERFSPFVDFYNNKEDLKNILKNMVEHGFAKKYSEEQRINFLRSNTWNERIKTILRNLD